MAEIKISELSIGDWVRFEDKSYKVIGIEKWRPNYVVVLEGWREIYTRGIKCIEPIPLTPEILEKNGFCKLGRFHEYEIGEWDSEPYMAVRLEEELVDPVILVKKECSSVYLFGSQGKYVHQLQHALRLAGVEKEIEV